MNVPPLFYKIETAYGPRRNQKWAWKASSLNRHDAEQIMFRNFIGIQTRVTSSDGRFKAYVPFGPLDSGE